MKKIILITAFLFTSTAFSQNVLVKDIQLVWNMKSKIPFDAQTTWLVPLPEKSRFDITSKLPLFEDKWEVAEKTEVLSFTIKNEVYASITESELADIDKKNVKDNLQIKLQVVSTRDKYHAYLSFVPVIKKGNQYKKLLSFQLNYKLGKRRFSRNNAYVSSSVLAAGTWYKFAVDTTGIYKIDKNFLDKIGINTKSINPQKLAIYGNGGRLLPYKIGDFRYDDLQENAIYIKGESDGKFDSGDYILFYAEGPDTWKHHGSIETVEHVRNIYSDKAYYFIHLKEGFGKRVAEAPFISDSPTQEFVNYDDYVLHEVDRVNLEHMGQTWLGESFDINNEQDFSFPFKNIDSSYPIQVRTRAVGVASTATNMDVIINANPIHTLNFNPITKYNHGSEKTVQTGGIPYVNDDITVKLIYNSLANPNADAYLDFIEIVGKKKLIAEGGQFQFRNFEMINTNNVVSYKIQNTANIFDVWDVTDVLNPKRLNNQGDGSNFIFKAQGGNLHEYIVLGNEGYLTPETLSNSSVENQNLHALNSVDYVIITKDFLKNEVEVLAQYHRDKGLNVQVVPLYKIYNEFGSGAKDITAIRDFVKFLYDTSSPHLQYVLLYGDVSYDYKNIYENDTENIVPAFESRVSFDITSSFVTDDYFAIVSDSNEGDLDAGGVQTQDVAIARLPVRTVSEAHQVTQKILHYYDGYTFGDWRNQIAMLADDPDVLSKGYLQSSEESLSNNIAFNKPVYNLKKIYADAYTQVISAGGAEYPEANKAFLDAVEKGVLIANYFGHGGEDGLAEEKLLTVQNIESWNNYDKLPLIMIISCEFARLDNPSRPNTAGEITMRNEHGAAGHLIATARAIGIGIGGQLNHLLMPLLLEYNGTSNSIAENLRLTKNMTSDRQRYFVFSLGDPAMKLAVPKPDIRITHMNDKPISEPLDTIKALSHVSFKGIVTKLSGVIDSDFNGEISITVFDKPVAHETLNNDDLYTFDENGDLTIPIILNFNTQESKIFRGSATVTHGEFSFDFIAPKDIRLAYGKGKLSFYADNTSIDKAGYNADITVGGIDENAPEDTQGPLIQLYMNDKSFIDGGTTNQSPLLLVALEDESGINTSLSSVDHDIVAFLDGDLQNPIILNDYYTTELNNYKKGGLEYRLRNLEIGNHTIRVKAYDTYNNASEANINFKVLDDGELILEHVLNYPNPFVNHTEFWFNHNKPDENLEVQIQIFTVSGKLVKTINQSILTHGSLSREITWDGLDDFGQKIGKGVYIYKLSVNAPNSGLKAEKFEKLVILQ